MRYIEHALEAMEPEELIKIVRNVLSHPEYAENDFSPMLRDITKKTDLLLKHKIFLSPKQKAVIKTHLFCNHKLWY